MADSSSPLDPKELDARLRRAVNDQRAGRLDDAEEAYQALVDHHSAKPQILYLLGTIACQRGRWEDGVTRLRAAIAEQPGFAQAHNDLGGALQNLGRVEPAIIAYTEAIGHDPKMFQAHYNLGTALQVAGRLDEAAEAYRSALVGDPGLAEAHNNLGTIHLSYGKYEEAAICFEAALGLRSDFAQAWNNLGTADSDRGEEERACEHFRQALKHDPDHVDALTNLATVLHKRGRVDEAVDGFRKALRLDPAKHVARARLRQAVGKVVPGWHFPMMNDAFCNQAYERAVRGAVTAETRVLDIGTGAGLLSLMAARAGARHVTSCEMVRVVAAKAKEVIAHNGFAERITVVPKKSNDIRVGVELPEPADLLVAEILSSDLLGEHVLPAVEHARAELLKPDARMIPYACGVVGFLGGGEDLERRNRVADVCGFELSPFNEFAPLRFSIRRQNYPYHRYSEDFEVFVFDFTTTPRFAAERKVLRIPVTQTGRCQGVVQWLKCWLDADNVFENHPDLPNPSSGWAHLFHAFPETVSLKAGETVRLIAEHDRLNLFIHLDGIESP